MSGAAKPAARKVFIKTFGCQMNEYDSDKMADVLRAAAGYEPTDDVEQADLVLFNTCSVREKAQEKVFSDLGRVKHLKARGVMIGVGGCVASQEGAAIVERAPLGRTSDDGGVESRYVLEVNRGWSRQHGVKPGAKVKFENVLY